MRLFIGTSIEDPIATRIENVAHKILTDPLWRMAPITQWHITALFIGERDPKELPMIEEAVENIAKRTPAILVKNGRIEAMPTNDPHMLWVKFDPAPQLTGLHLSLAEATSTRPSEHLPITPHITLARSRRSPSPTVSEIFLDELKLDHLSLFRSELLRSGAVHHLLKKVRLAE